MEAVLSKLGTSVGEENGRVGPTEAERKAHEVRSKRLANEDGIGDWAARYAAMADLVAEDEYEEKVRLAKESAEREARRQAVGGCSHDHSAERKLMEMSTREKIDQCRMFRAEGNAWFQEGQFFRAAEKYRKVTVWLDYTFPETEELDEEMRDVHLPALVNLAVCCLKMKDYSGVLEISHQVLDLDPENIKVLYSTAKSYRRLAKFKEADEFLKKSLSLDPENIELRREYHYLQNSILEYKELSAKRARAMFTAQGEASTINEKGQRGATSNRQGLSRAPEHSTVDALLGEVSFDDELLRSSRMDEDEEEALLT